MKNIVLKLYIFLFSTLHLFCSKLPDEETGLALKMLDSAKHEGVDVKSPKEYYYLHDTIYKVLEEIERKSTKLFPGDYEKQKKQLRLLVYQLESVRRLSKPEGGVSDEID